MERLFWTSWVRSLIFTGVKCLELSSTSSEGVGQEKAVSYTKEKKNPLILSIEDKPVNNKTYLHSKVQNYYEFEN